MVEHPAGGVGLEAADALGQIGSLCQIVQMVFQHHVAVQSQTLIGLLVAPAVEQDVDQGGAVFGPSLISGGGRQSARFLQGVHEQLRRGEQAFFLFFLADSPLRQLAVDLHARKAVDQRA